MKVRRAFSLLSLLLTGCHDKAPPTPPPPSVSTVKGGTDPQTGEIRYLALGDSISEGKGTPAPAGASLVDAAKVAFPAQLIDRWRSHGCIVSLMNLGVAHATAADVVAKQLPVLATPFNPTIITFQIGSNDIATKVPVETFRGQVRTILEAAKKTGARIVVLGQNEWWRSPEGGSYGGSYDKRDAFDAVLGEETKTAGGELIDLRLLYRQQADRKLWAEDGIHPTNAAYAEMADELARVLPMTCPKR